MPRPLLPVELCAAMPATLSRLYTMLALAGSFAVPIWESKPVAGTEEEEGEGDKRECS